MALLAPSSQAACDISEIPDDFQFTQDLQKGSQGTEVKYLQLVLQCIVGEDVVGPADGIFGTKTETAVKQYQAMRGLVVDGIVGPNTRAALNADLAVLKVPPTVVSTNPADGDLAAPVTDTITATFSEDIQAGTLSVLIIDATQTFVPIKSVTVNGKTLTISLIATLTHQMVYAVSISKGAVKDLVGNPNPSYIWGFVTAAPNPPDKPILISPADGAIDVSITPILSWYPVDRATDYYVQVSRNLAFTDIVFDEVVASTSMQVSLAHNTQYFWRVLATIDLILGPWSDVWKFTTIQQRFNLTINISGQGTTTPSPGTHTYDEGTQVTVTAIPDPGWEFEYWSGDASGSKNPITITMSSDKNITAHFKELPSPVTVRVIPQKDPIAVGETTTIDVLIESVSNIGGFEFRLYYNSSIIEINTDDVQMGDFLPQDKFYPLGPNIKAAGNLNELVYGALLLGSASGQTGSGTLARITVKGVGAGTTSLDLNDVLIIDASSSMNQPIVNIIDSSITVKGQPPVANFTGNPREGCASLTVNFTDQSTGSPTSWSWSFGDGGTSTQQNPSHIYTNPGTYTVSLTAANNCGSDTETKTNYIEVKSPKKADFTFSPESPKEGEEVQFTDQSTPQAGIVSWSWNFGDGNTSTEQHPKHTYKQANNPSQTFSVTLTVEWSDGDSDTETKSVEVDDKDPVAQFHWEPSEPEVGQEITFFDDSESYDGIASWNWDFGDGGTSPEKNPKHVYLQAGTYKVKLTVKEADEDTDTYSKDIIISCFFADVNCDNKVNVFDVLLVATAWGTCVGEPDYKDEYDLNEDECISIDDLTMVAKYWGDEAPFEIKAVPSLASLDMQIVTFQADSSYIRVGDVACFDIITQGDNQVQAFELRLSYDADVLEFKEAQLGEMLKGQGDKNTVLTLGPKLDKQGQILYGGIYLGYDTHAPVSGTIARLEFIPKQVGELQLDISYLKLVDSQWQLLPIAIKKQIPQMILPQAPKKSALLQNYPNPFNPDTWIPYQLSKNADVTIRIYNVKGQLIRQIYFGHKQAGYYLDKSEAAYWDGKNNAGENTASGIYFYQLQTGDFRAMRRMVIVK